jgi:protein TonB
MASGSPIQAFQGNPAFGAVPRDFARGSASLLVLTRDEALVRTLRTIGPEYTVVAVGTDSDFASHLLSHPAGVAILDARAVASSLERLSERLRAQFPDLVLIVAGSVDDQSALATQITNGTIYRFLHKPVSDQRVKLFVDAAWRRHSEELAGISSTANAASPERVTRGPGSNMLVLGGVALGVAAVVGGWWVLHKTSSMATRDAAAAHDQTAASRDAVLEDDLARADKALASGALVAPPGANAADLYARALRRNPREPRAINGQEQVIDRLLSAAEAQLLARHLDEAQKLADQARAIKPDHVRVAFLAAQIGKERERAVLAQARQAERLVSDTRKLLGSGNADQAQQAIKTASDAGVSQDDIDALNQEAEHVRATTNADALAHREAGVDAAEINNDIKSTRDAASARDAASTQNAASAQDGAAVAAKTNPVAADASLVIKYYVPPEFPIAARARATSGWVDLQFMVMMDGSVSDLSVVGADPVGVFETPATDAVRKWKYQPILRDGKPINQRARVRVRFALQK